MSILSRRRVLLIAALAILANPALAGNEVDLFNEHCAACHTIGGGESGGPDLITSAALPPDELRAAVDRMQEHTGPLTAELIDTFVELLRRPAARDLIAGVPAETPPAAGAPQGSPENGRQLFFGKAAFANGGSPCHACHAVKGRGGTLARDLTDSYARLGERSLVVATEKAPYPVMKGAYAGRRVTREEARDVAAYLKTAPAEPPARENAVVPQGAAGGLAVIVLAGLVFGIRSRRAAVRSRSSQKSGRR